MALLVSAVTIGSAITVNIATDLKDSAWPWAVVIVLVFAGAGLTMWSRPSSTESNTVSIETVEDAATPSAHTPGTAHEPVTPTGDNANAPTNADTPPMHVRQNAIGFGRSVIQQSGGDIHNYDGRRPRQ